MKNPINGWFIGFFMYLCNGINTADLVWLKYKDIVDGEICYVRQKTARTTNTIKEIRAIITPEMQEIIERWGNPPLPDNRSVVSGFPESTANCISSNRRQAERRVELVRAMARLEGVGRSQLVEHTLRALKVFYSYYRHFLLNFCCFALLCFKIFCIFVAVN
jgi:hypothetical protein